MRIADNGKGFDAALPTDRNGLKNIRSRAAKWKGTVIVDTSKSGTTLFVGMQVI